MTTEKIQYPFGKKPVYLQTGYGISQSLVGQIPNNFQPFKSKLQGKEFKFDYNEKGLEDLKAFQSAERKEAQLIAESKFDELKLQMAQFEQDSREQFNKELEGLWEIRESESGTAGGILKNVYVPTVVYTGQSIEGLPTGSWFLPGSKKGRKIKQLLEVKLGELFEEKLRSDFQSKIDEFKFATEESLKELDAKHAEQVLDFEKEIELAKVEKQKADLQQQKETVLSQQKQQLQETSSLNVVIPIETVSEEKEKSKTQTGVLRNFVPGRNQRRVLGRT